MKNFINFLPPWVETNMQPAFYDKESGTCLQQTARMYAKVNQLVRIANEQYAKIEEYIAKFVELKDYVEDYFENLDVQEEINNKLDEMAEDGTLEEIMGDYLNKGYLNDNFYIYPIRKGRYLTKTTRNPDYDATVDFPSMQGGCYVGNDHFIQARIVDGNTNRTQLQEINLSTGNIIRTSVLELQHANSLTYDPENNYVYVTSLMLNGSYTQYIYVLDYTTWNIVKTIDLSTKLETNEGTHCISYDTKNKTLILGIELKSVNAMRFAFLDPVSEELTDITLTDKYSLLSEGANNDITVYDNHLYLIKHKPNCVSEWNLNTGELIKVYNIPRITPQGWTQGECESITYSEEEEVFYLAAACPDCKGGYISMNSYYTFDLIHNQPYIPAFTSESDIVKEVRVDSDSTAWNPDGNSWEKAFATIGEASQLLNMHEFAGLQTTLRNGKTYPFVNVHTEKVLTITPSDPSGAETIINSINLEDSNSVYITSVTITGISSYYNFDLKLKRSTAEVTSCKFGGDYTAHIDVWHSKLRFYNLSIINSTTNMLFNCRAENELVSLDTTPSYNAMTNMPAINKPVLVTSCSSITSSFKTYSFTNGDLMLLSNKLFLSCSGLSYQCGSFCLTQKTDGGNRNVTLLFDNVMCKYQIVFDYTNSQLKCKLTKAINLETGDDVTATTTGTAISVFIYT